MIEIFKDKTDVEIYRTCTSEYAKDTELHDLREFIKSNNYGFCDDAHHVMWREVVRLLPDSFNFLEIGVFKGQILCLVPNLAKRFNKECNFIGVTPMSNAGDKFSTYNDENYEELISQLFLKFDIDFDVNSNIIKGLSTDETVKDKLKNTPFDVIYVDGGHDYETVVSDILLCKEILNINGYIVTDDSSCYKNLSGLPIFTGHVDVCNAIRDYLENDTNYVEIACVGHNRVFKRIS